MLTPTPTRTPLLTLTEVDLPGMPHGRACVLDCPLLNCTRGVELCFASPNCAAVDIGFQLHGHAAVARLRFSK